MTLPPISAPSRAIVSLPAKPPLSLAVGVFYWMQKYIRQPDGPDAGGPFVLTFEQFRFMWHFYAVDRTGRFLWSRAILRRAKGWGKSPFLAALALVELCGPCRFSHFDKKTGEPVGKPVPLPLVQIAGVSERQTNNTMSMVLAMCYESPIVEEYGLDLGLTRIYTRSGGKLEPISASAPTAEGARPTFCVLDETHLWLDTNGGHKLAEVIRRNLGKSRDGAARSVETTNAHELGRDSVAERSHNAWAAQQARTGSRATILYDSREAPADTSLSDPDSLRLGLVATYGDSTWVDFERLEDEINDPANPPSESRRFYLNQLVVSEDAWVTPQEWDKLADKTKVILPDDEIAIALDGSKSDDWTALIGCRISDGHTFSIGIWNPLDFPGKEAPRTLIDKAVQDSFRDHDVVAFFSDLAEWESYVDKWAEEHGDTLCAKASTHHPIAFDMRGHKLETVQMVENMHDAIETGAFTHDGNITLAQHVYNSRRRPGPYGVSIAKEESESPLKIDACVAAALARKARQAYLALPNSKRRKKKTGRAVFA